MIKEFRFKGHSILMFLEPDAYPSDAGLLTYLESNRVPEPEVVHVMLRALKPGHHAIDAGANVGFFTVLMSKLVGETGKVLAIEPDSRNLLKLAKNLDINDCKNVTIIGSALGAESGSTILRERTENGTSSVYGPLDACPGLPVRVVTLTEMIDAYYFDPVFLKMDIEGSETEAFAGCEHFIPYIVSEVNEDALRSADSSVAELVENMRIAGYAPFNIRYDGTLPGMVRRDQTIRPTRQNANMLFTEQRNISKLWPEVEI